MEPKWLLIIYAVVVTPVLLSFLFMKKGSGAPTRLDLGGKDMPPGSGAPGASPKGPPSPSPKPPPKPAAPATPRVEYRPRAPSPTPPKPPAEKQLNVMFNWNGHMWDAYEVLGLPAGSGRDSVHAAYQKQLTGGNAEDTLFFKAAYEAIVRSGHTRS